MLHGKKLCRTDADIKVAADLWCFDRAAAEELYGHISERDVSSVTDMNHLFAGRFRAEPLGGRFRCKELFNDDISRWDVSNVINMLSMFGHARAFNQPVRNWDVSNVTDMNCLFARAHSFNQDLTRWDMRSVTDADFMFHNAPAMQIGNKPASLRLSK
jgi:surface protein